MRVGREWTRRLPFCTVVLTFSLWFFFHQAHYFEEGSITLISNTEVNQKLPVNVRKIVQMYLHAYSFVQQWAICVYIQSNANTESHNMTFNQLQIEENGPVEINSTARVLKYDNIGIKNVKQVSRATGWKRYKGLVCLWNGRMENCDRSECLGWQ